MSRMSKSVDDIWNALKASTAPSDARAGGRSATALGEGLSLHSLRERPHPNGMCGNTLPHGLSASDAIKHTRDTVFTQRDVNCLSDPDRNLRRQAIKKLTTLITSTKPESWPRDLTDVLESETLRRNAILMLNDPTDVCREMATDVLKALILAPPEDEMFMLQALEALKHRMGIGHPCPLESSEEIRLKISILTSTAIVLKASTSGESAVHDIAAILSRCLDDSFHETKKSACLGVTALTHQCQHDDLAHTCALIVKSLVELFRHPHSRVRAAGIQALSALGEKTPFSVELLTSKVVPALRVTAIDKSVDLRVATYRACAAWLLQDVQSARRDMSMSHLLPILLLGVTDSDAGAAVEAVEILRKVGELFCSSQNVCCASNVCEEVEMSTANRETAAAASLPPPLDKRAPAALRAMMSAQLHTILPPILDDVKEWTVTLRSTASRSLCSIMALAEHRITRYLDRILPCLCQAVGDEDEAVTVRIIHCMHVVGAFCEVHHWMPLMLEYVSKLKGQPHATVCALVTLSTLVCAAERASRQADQILIRQVAEWLASEDMRSMQHLQLHKQLVMVVANIIDLAGAAAASIAQQLFQCLMHLRGHTPDEEDADLIQRSQQKLAEACGVDSASELAGLHACSIVAGMLQHSQQWTATHPDMPSFLSILRTSPGHTLVAMGRPLCAALSSVTGDHERDPELRMAFLRGLDAVLEDDDQGCAFCKEYGNLLVETVILPPLTWRAGKSAAAVRYSALHALYTLLSKQRVTPQSLAPMLAPQGQLLPLLIQSMDEDWYADTRKLACCSTAALLQLAGGHFTDDTRRQLYPELTKRMDDSNNNVRITAAAAVHALATYGISSSYCDTNTGYFIAAFLIHLDDSDRNIQTAVMTALQAVKVKKPAVLRSEIDKVYDSFRSKYLLDQLKSAN